MSNATHTPEALVFIDETAKTLDECTDPARYALTILETVSNYGRRNGAWLEKSDPARVPIARLVSSLADAVIIRRAIAAGVKVTPRNRDDVLKTPTYRDGMSRANVSFYFRAATVAETLAIPLDTETAPALYRLASRHGKELSAWCESPRVARMTSDKRRADVLALVAKCRKQLRAKTTNDENGNGAPDAPTVNAEGSNDSTRDVAHVGNDETSAPIEYAGALVRLAATVGDWSNDERTAMRAAIDAMHDALDRIETDAIARASV